MSTSNPIADPIHPLVEAISRRTAELVIKSLGLESQRLLTVSQAAAYLGRSAHSIRHLIATGALPRVQRADNRVFLDKADLDAWIELAKKRG